MAQSCAQCNKEIENDRILWCAQKGLTCKYCKTCSASRKAAKALVGAPAYTNPSSPTYPETKPDWDKIALGKIAHGFLLEAYRIGKEKGTSGTEVYQQESAKEAYRWAMLEISVQNRLDKELKDSHPQV